MIIYFKNCKEIYNYLYLKLKQKNSPFIISGGNTIKKVFRFLDNKILNLSLLADERLVNRKSKLRNDFFFKNLFNNGLLNKKKFIHYKLGIKNEDYLEKFNKKIRSIKFKIAILSLGSGGHYASIFKKSNNNKDFYFIENSPKFPRCRVTISIRKLRECKQIYFIASKRKKKKEVRFFYKNQLIKSLDYKKIKLLIY